MASEDTKDMLISRIPRLEAEIVNYWAAKNRLRKKDLIVILARLVTSRSWLRDNMGGEGWDEFDTLVKHYLKEAGHPRYADMSFVERYLGFGIQPVTKRELRKLQEKIMQSRLEEGE